MKTSPFRNIKALVAGVLLGLVVFGGVMAYHAAFPKYVTDSQPGSVIVRPIRKDDGVKNFMFAILLGAAGFYFGTRTVARRLDKRN